MDTKLQFLLILTTFSAISLQAADARFLHFKLKKTTLIFNSPAILGQAIAKAAGSFVHAHQENARRNVSSIRAVKFYDLEVDHENGGLTAAAPSPSSPKESALKAMVVMVILRLITSCAAALIRIICVNSDRPSSERNEPRAIAEEAQQHLELTFCKCNTFALFT